MIWDFILQSALTVPMKRKANECISRGAAVLGAHTEQFQSRTRTYGISKAPAACDKIGRAIP